MTFAMFTFIILIGFELDYTCSYQNFYFINDKDCFEYSTFRIFIYYEIFIYITDIDFMQKLLLYLIPPLFLYF